MFALYMDSSCKADRDSFRYQTRMYIRLFSGVANSQLTMYAHPGSYLGRWTRSPQSGTGFTGTDILI